MVKAKTVKSFVSESDCKYLIDSAIKSDAWENAGDSFWDSRVINYNTMLKFDKTSASIMKDINKRSAEMIKSIYGLDSDIYSDLIQIVRWFPEMEQRPHADDMSNSDIKGFDHREYGSIVYLNNNYEGGHTYYPNFDLEIIPEVGKLAIHPGDVEHLHGVTKIKNTTRYTVASFWTSNRKKANNYGDMRFYV
jgi:hypothetical protein